VSIGGGCLCTAELKEEANGDVTEHFHSYLIVNRYQVTPLFQTLPFLHPPSEEKMEVGVSLPYQRDCWPIVRELGHI
jgi:hypothetical protein